MIKKYLKQILKMHKTNKNNTVTEYYKWVLQAGESFKGAQYLENRGKMKQCYYNAQSLAISDSQHKYYEGWGITSFIGLPFEHGFNVKNNQVYDATWKDGRYYLGILIPIKFVRKSWHETSCANNLLFKYFMSLRGEMI